MNRIARSSVGCAAVLTLGVIGCDETNCPTAPQVGTITIDAEPNSIDAAWTLTSPAGFSETGAGDRVLTGMSVGDYTLAWGGVRGWTSPEPSPTTQTLSEGGLLTFSGSYIFDTGTIMIDVEPNSVSAPWMLTGPNSYVTHGTGDLTLSGLPTGNYTVTWESVVDWKLPNPSVRMRSLQRESSLLFQGVYVEAALVPDDFVYIGPGTFEMGSPTYESGRKTDETQHTVTLTRGIVISRFEVTEQWWSEVMGETPTTSKLPKVNVSWDMAVEFCNALSLREGLTPAYTILSTNGDVTWNQEASGYRLPTEAEWEYACRAGRATAFHNGTNCLSADTEANYEGFLYLTGCSPGIYRGVRTTVGSFLANAWGLHDMHGNVYEWVWDGYRADYQNLPGTDPSHDVGLGAHRVVRGGGLYSGAHTCRSAYRWKTSPMNARVDYGVRPVRSEF